jgi:hypothetical protein
LKLNCIFLAILCQTCFLSAQTAPSTASLADNDLWQPTAELNKELPAWLQFNGSYRIRVEDQDGIAFKNVSDTHALGQFQFGVKVQPITWLSFYGQTQDAHMYWNGPVAKAPPYQNTWDLHQAWGEIGSTEKYHFKIRAGRQELNFGEQRLVGAAPWFNSPRVFDAALATVAFSGVRVDTFASSVVNSVDEQMDHHKQGNPFYGIYGGLTKLVPKATIEPYVFWRLAPVGFSAAYASGLKGKLDEKTYGFRFVGKLPAQFDYGVEMAGQTGTLGADSIGAWAGHWGMGRTFTVKFQPRLLAEYNYASGTANPNGTKTSTFDQLYPSGHDKFGLTDQVGWRNIRDLRTGVELKPASKLSIAGIYHDLWLADARDGLYAANGTVTAKSLSGVAGTHVGQEFDIQSMYKYNKAVQFGLGFGHLAPGEFLKITTPGKAYNYPYTMLTYAF